MKNGSFFVIKEIKKEVQYYANIQLLNIKKGLSHKKKEIALKKTAPGSVQEPGVGVKLICEKK